jgi:uncharacterized protein YccT (UPF0319 family)
MKTMKAAKPVEKMRDWSHFRDMWVRVLEKQTGKDLSYWNARVGKEKFADTRSLETWLAKQNVTGYAQQLLVMERFGYPDFLTASADKLIEAQYADRRRLRPIYDAIIAAVRNLGEFVVQARKGYVSLVTPRRTFARVQATTKNRVDLGLRIDGQKPGGRLQPSRIHETMELQISFTARDEVDAEALGWLKKAYDQNS